MTLLVAGLSACCYAVVALGARDYLGAMMLVFAGTSLLRGAAELLRSTLEA